MTTSEKVLIQLLVDGRDLAVLEEAGHPYKNALAQALHLLARQVGMVLECRAPMCRKTLPTEGLFEFAAVGLRYLRAHSIRHVDPLGISHYFVDRFAEMWIGLDLLDWYTWVRWDKREGWVEVEPLVLADMPKLFYTRSVQPASCKGCGRPLEDTAKQGRTVGNLQYLNGNVVFVDAAGGKYDLDCVLPLPRTIDDSLPDELWDMYPYWMMQKRYSETVGAPSTLRDTYLAAAPDELKEAYRVYQKALAEHIYTHWKQNKLEKGEDK